MKTTHRGDDITIRRAQSNALAVFLQVRGIALRDHLQDIAAMTTVEAWKDAVVATEYMTDPPAYGMTHEQAETRLLDALDRLAEQVGMAHFTMGPVQTGRVRAELDVAIGGAA